MAKPAEQSEAANSVPVDETVESDLECAGCGYNLRTLGLKARCPECGLAVDRSFPPPRFRFRKMATAIRVRRGLTLVVLGILFQVLHALALLVVMRGIFVLPRTAVLVVIRSMPYIGLATYVPFGLGLVLITYPFGRRGDRFLRPLGIAVASLLTLFFGACLVGTLAPSAGGVPFGLNWHTYESVTAPFVYCLCASHVLAWICLLARVRAADHGVVWSVTLLTLLTQAFLLAQGICRYVSFVSGSALDAGPSGAVSWGVPDNWLGGWERQINGLAWIVTLIGVWMFLRGLNGAIGKLVPFQAARFRALGRG